MALNREAILAKSKALRVFDVPVPHLDGEIVRVRELSGFALEQIQRDLEGKDDESVDAIVALLAQVIVDDDGALAFAGEQGVKDLKALPVAMLLFLGQKAGELIGLTPEAIAGEAKN